MGYGRIYKGMEGSDMGMVELRCDGEVLGEVIVKGKLGVRGMKGDGMVRSVEKRVLRKGGWGNDVVGKIGGIRKREESYEVLGKGSGVIYIKGRKVNEVREVEEVNGDEIKNVEVIFSYKG